MTTRNTLIKNADNAMSRYIRLSQAVKSGGYVYCVTCKTSSNAGDRRNLQPMYWRGDGAQAGHFIPKGKGASAVRWLPHNVHVQCGRCNTYLSGNLTEYTRYMDSIYGAEIVDDLRARKWTTIKYTDDEIKEIALIYDELADKLENSL